MNWEFLPSFLAKLVPGVDWVPFWTVAVANVYRKSQIAVAEEKPFFCSRYEEPVAANVKCPLHGNRFRQPIFHLYVSRWRRETEPARRERLSAQYRKAWEASFPSEVWPAVPKEEREDGNIFFRLKDGTKFVTRECAK